MDEIKNPRITEKLNEVQELQEILQKFDIKQEEVSGFKIELADSAILKRLEKVKFRFHEGVNINEFDEKKYLRELKQDLKECNPNYDLGIMWKINCQRCAPTFEMRRRGYDVTALPRKFGDQSGLEYHPFDVWKNPEVIHCKGNGLADIERNMEKWGNGARAEIVVMWKGGGSGHAFVAERVNGKTRFYDPQNANMDVSAYFNRVESDSVKICRTDNLEINEGKMKLCCKRRI